MYARDEIVYKIQYKYYIVYFCTILLLVSSPESIQNSIFITWFQIPFKNWTQIYAFKKLFKYIRTAQFQWIVRRLLAQQLKFNSLFLFRKPYAIILTLYYMSFNNSMAVNLFNATKTHILLHQLKCFVIKLTFLKSSIMALYIPTNNLYMHIWVFSKSIQKSVAVLQKLRKFML